MENSLLMSRYYFVVIIVFLLSGCQQLEPLKVRAEGRGFYWFFTLAGADGQFDTADDIKSDKEIHLPKNRKVLIEVTSSDYLYMFRSTKLDVREVAVPKMVFTIDFVPQQLGEFELEVDPLCGFNFAHDNDIMGYMTITSNESFEAWVASKS